LHRIAPQCPVLLAANSTIEISLDALAQTGIVEVLRRPVANTELAAILARCLHSAGALRR
jgi:BarA-like signal transduction histidine kinase